MHVFGGGVELKFTSTQNQRSPQNSIFKLMDILCGLVNILNMFSEEKSLCRVGPMSLSFADAQRDQQAQLRLIRLIITQAL